MKIRGPHHCSDPSLCHPSAHMRDIPMKRIWMERNWLLENWCHSVLGGVRIEKDERRGKHREERRQERRKHNLDVKRKWKSEHLGQRKGMHVWSPCHTSRKEPGFEVEKTDSMQESSSGRTKVETKQKKEEESIKISCTSEKHPYVPFAVILTHFPVLLLATSKGNWSSFALATITSLAMQYCISSWRAMSFVCLMFQSCATS